MSMENIDYAGMLEWATPRQKAVVEALQEHGTYAKAAEALGVTAKKARDLLYKLRRKAARQGWAPREDMDKLAPPGFHTKGVSTLYDREGNVVSQWVKTKADQESRTEILLEAIESIAEPFRGTSLNPPAPETCNEDLLCVYPMGDPHLGMLATARMSGVDFDLETAEENLVAAVDALVELAPAAKQALIINLGDFYHSDLADRKTARSGHVLDVDGNDWSNVLIAGIRTMRRCIDRAVEKHETVRVINAIGNHDDHSSLMLSVALAEYYENNPRVEIDLAPRAFHWYRFGANLIGVTHGNAAKGKDLLGVMAVDQKEHWGETDNDKRWFYTGHIHHDTLKEFPGLVVESFRTLASKNAYEHRNGYRAGRDMKCDVIHRRHGKTNRYIVGVEQLLPKERDE